MYVRKPTVILHGTSFYQKNQQGKNWKAFLTAACFAIQVSNLYGQQINVQNPTLPTNVPVIPRLNTLRYETNASRSQINRSIIDADVKNYYERKSSQEDIFTDASPESKSEGKRIRYTFPNRAGRNQERYEQTFRLLSAMIRGEAKLDLKQAVFAVEQAYDTNLVYADFNKRIQEAVSIIGEKMKEDKMNPLNNTAKIMTLFRYMTDTLQVYSAQVEKKVTSYPKSYDFEDFWGRQDYRKMFVSKLLQSNGGQCHSLPLLFLILSDEINAEAYLSFAPNHSFIKFKDQRAKWHNLELTNGMLASDHFMIQSGYIKAEAIQSRIYLEPVSRRETIAQCLNDLAQEYIREFGYDTFVKRCTNEVLGQFENNLTAHQINANYYSSLAELIVTQYRMNGWSRNKLEGDPEAMRIINSAIGAGKRIEKFGFADMPADAYEAWLGSVRDEIERRRHEAELRGLNTMIERR